MTIEVFRRRVTLLRRAQPSPAAFPSVGVTFRPPVVSVLRGLQWSLIALAIGSAALAGWWWQESRELERASAGYDTATARVETLNRQFEANLVRDGLTLPGDQVALVQGKVAFANLLALKRAFSWTRLLSELEETVPPQVSIESVKLDTQHAAIVVDGTAKDLQSVNAFIQSLQAHRAFQRAVLAKHEVRTGRDGRPITLSSEGSTDVLGAVTEFTLAVGYRPAVRNEEMAE